MSKKIFLWAIYIISFSLDAMIDEGALQNRISQPLSLTRLASKKLLENLKQKKSARETLNTLLPKDCKDHIREYILNLHGQTLIDKFNSKKFISVYPAIELNHPEAHIIVLSPDHQHIVTYGKSSDSCRVIKIWDMFGHLKIEIPVNLYIRDISFSHDSKFILIHGELKLPITYEYLFLKVFDLQGNEISFITPDNHKKEEIYRAYLREASFSPKGDKIIAYYLHGDLFKLYMPSTLIWNLDGTLSHRFDGAYMSYNENQDMFIEGETGLDKAFYQRKARSGGLYKLNGDLITTYNTLYISKDGKYALTLQRINGVSVIKLWPYDIEFLKKDNKTLPDLGECDTDTLIFLLLSTFYKSEGNIVKKIKKDNNRYRENLDAQGPRTGMCIIS